jgi:hypothetical protein
VQSDDLNNVWVCTNCQASFMFLSDVADHKEQTGHTEISQVNLDNGKLMGHATTNAGSEKIGNHKTM